MKKIYLLAAAVAFTFSANAQFDESFDDYNLTDDLATQSINFINWSGTSGTGEDGFMSDAIAAGGSGNSFLVGGNTSTDVVGQFGDVGTGTWTLAFDYYIADGHTGFYGIMNTAVTDPAPDFPLDFRINAVGGDATIAVDNTVQADFTFPLDTWVRIVHIIDLDASTVVVTHDGVEVYSGEYTASTLGGIDLWSLNADCENYFDNMVFASGILGADDFSADVFSVYPNPVEDVLNINSAASVDSVVIYDVLGKVVHTTTPGVISPRINMSALSSGAYLVQVTIGSTSKVVKVIK